MTKLADHTTLRVGGEAKEFHTATSEAELIDLVSDADARNIPVLILGCGSNILVSDSGFDGRVVKVGTRGIDEATDACSGGFITVQAGEDWDGFVTWAVSRGFVGVETLAGIPGTVGAAPIQNIGAYGHEVSEVIARVRIFDRKEGKVRTLSVSDCGFGYRTSLFKREPDRYLVLDLAFQMKQGELSLPIQYQELADRLSLAIGERAPIARVRDAVIEIRKSKGMVLDKEDRDTFSAGSFFTNPIVDAEKVPQGAPSWPANDGRKKVSAAWLIENSGVSKGERIGGAAISTKHVLALTNHESAKADDLYRLAELCKVKVSSKFGIELESEVRLLGFA